MKPTNPNIPVSFLRACVKRWQKRLRLSDWEIDVAWVTQKEMTEFFNEDEDDSDNALKMGELAVAATDIDSFNQYNTSPLEHRHGRIVLKRGAFDSRAEVESAIIHELLHVLFWTIAPSTEDKRGEVLLEQIILTIESVIAEGFGTKTKSRKKR